MLLPYYMTYHPRVTDPLKVLSRLIERKPKTKTWLSFIEISCTCDFKFKQLRISHTQQWGTIFPPVFIKWQYMKIYFKPYRNIQARINLRSNLDMLHMQLKIRWEDSHPLLFQSTLHECFYIHKLELEVTQWTCSVQPIIMAFKLH
jgi:hypothetical protein